MNRLKICVAALLSVSVTTLTACSITDKLGGNTQSPPAEATTTEAQQFDTGDYKTEPATVTGEVDEQLANTLAVSDLAEYVPLPFEIDPVVSEGRGSQLIFGAKSMAISLSDTQVTILEDNGLLYGYQNNAKSPTEKATDTGFSVNHAVLRFKDPQTAENAANALHQEAITAGQKTLEGEPPIPQSAVEIEGVPQARVYATNWDFEDTISYTSFTPQAEYLIYTWAKAPKSEEQWNANFVKQAYDKQLPLLLQYPSVKTSEGYGATTEFPQLDPGNILIYAVPHLEGEQNQRIARLGPRGVSALFKATESVYNSLVEAGSQYNAQRASIVFRAENEFGAQAILNNMLSKEHSNGAKPYDEPQGVPDTTCVSEDTTSGATFACYVVNGRYVAEMSAFAKADEQDQEIKKKELSQRAAAQYLIFQKADQKAGLE